MKTKNDGLGVGSVEVDGGVTGDGSERRQHARAVIDQPAKVFHRGSWRYIAARTRDLSDGGVLLELPADRPLAVGDMVDVAIGRSGVGVLKSDEFVWARVVRVSASSRGGSLAAVSLTRPLAAASAA
jgi:hypothetical protein